MSELVFTAYGTPVPQGSMKAFVRGNRAMITSDNTRLKPYRHTLTQVAMEAMMQLDQGWIGPLCSRDIPVEVSIVWTLAKPKSTAKRVTQPIRKPDADKLLRACLDALTGVAYEDDAQVVSVVARKQYGAPERTEITVRSVLGALEKGMEGR